MARRVSPFTRLPLELVYRILGLAAAASRRSNLDICLVASWARHIALPHLFHAVVIKNKASNSQLNKFLLRPPYSPYNSSLRVAPFVTSIWMECIHDLDCIIPVYESCHNLTHIALYPLLFFRLLHLTTPNFKEHAPEMKISGHVFDHSHDMGLTLLAPMDSRASLFARSPLFHRITHIRLATIKGYDTQQSLELFRRLSHLSVPYQGVARHQPIALRGFLKLESLQMLVIAIIKENVREADREELEKWVKEVRKTDCRVYLVERPTVDIQAEWEDEMRSGRSIWERAIRYTASWEARAIPSTLPRSAAIGDARYR